MVGTTCSGVVAGNGMVWYGMVWYGMVWYGMVWYGMVWYGMVWYGMVWYGMVWYGMVWYGMVCCCCCCCCGTQHVPAGEIARHALPGQGAREQTAGVTLAGRVPTTTEGGGGAMVWGGGGVRAWRRVGLPLDVTLEPSPAAGGRVTRPVRSGGGGGAGWRDHLSGEMRGPDSPCFQPPLPRDRGGGYFLCEGGVRG